MSMYSTRDIIFQDKLETLKNELKLFQQELLEFMESDDQTDFSFDYLESVYDSISDTINTI